MKTFTVVHNIPAPYRLHLFRVLEERLRLRGLCLFVHFMSQTDLQRPHWRAKPEELTFPHRFWRTFTPVARDHEFFFNPGLIAYLAVRRPDYLLVGGPWETLTGMILSQLPTRHGAVAWIEGNTQTPGRLTGWVSALKRSRLRRFPIVAVPGQEGAGLVRLLLRVPPFPRIAMLPNIVDESRFRPREAGDDIEKTRAALGVGPGQRLALWNARLLPEKGVLEFLSAVDPASLAGWTIAILGEGPLLPQIEALLLDRRLQAGVKLVPYLPYERMPGIYRAADLLLLPSIRDPNPLSIVEALHSGLPLLISNRLGNCPEALRPGENGWAFSPADPAEVRAVAAKAFAQAPETLRAMGIRSAEIGRSFWASSAAVDRFLDVVLEQ